jgi:hypothetical protein
MMMNIQSTTKPAITKQTLAKLALSGMMLGGLILTGCEKSSTAPKEETGKTGIAAASTLAQFKMACEAMKGTYAEHDCSTHNSCKGHSFQEGVVVAHDCSGKSSCAGASCVEG